MERKCDKCQLYKNLHNDFRKYKTDNYSKTCKKCLNELDKQRKKQKRKDIQETSIFECEICKEQKALKFFSKLKKFYKRKICKICYPLFVTKQKTDWCKNQHNTNINYRLKKSLAARLRAVLKKENTTMSYIGCNILYLREWLQYNFTSDMSWDNYGTYWSIDHVIPVSKFDLTDENDKYKCWNWSNLFPVTVEYNSSKKNSLDTQQINKVIKSLKTFKEEGSTTKWFSDELLNLFFSNLNLSSS